MGIPTDGALFLPEPPAIGPLAMGLAYDVAGSYSQAWLLLFFSFLIAIGLVQLARRPTPPGQASS